MPDTWNYTADEFSARDGVQLARAVCRPGDEARATVAVVHGYGEHAGRYLRLGRRARGARLLQRARTTSAAMAGRPGAAATSARFKEYLDDTGRFLDWARLQARGLPLFLLGSQHGRPHRGARSSSSAVPTISPASSSRRPSCGWRSRCPGQARSWPTSPPLVAPSLDVGNTLDAAGLSRDDEVVAAYRPTRSITAWPRRGGRRRCSPPRGRRSRTPAASPSGCW